MVYQGDVILGRMAMGADYVNPAACVELFWEQLQSQQLSHKFLFYMGAQSPFFFIMTQISYGVSTELDAVNSILMSVGESPVNTLTVQSPEVAIAQKTLRASLP